jgi:hypothetical protein
MNYGNNTQDNESILSFYCISGSHNAFAAVLDMIHKPFMRLVTSAVVTSMLSRSRNEIGHLKVTTID